MGSPLVAICSNVEAPRDGTGTINGYWLDQKASIEVGNLFLEGAENG